MPPGWTTTRARILRRDPVCRLCQAAPSAEVHHLRPGVEADAWLLGVCEPCHLAETQRQAALARHLASPSS
jgi:5-methylcytosine-specific restriction protein A